MDYFSLVKKNGWALEDVPERLITAELCLAAVKKYGGAITHVPERLKTIIKEMLKNDN